MLERYVASVSTYSADIDGLILLIGVIVGFWFLVAEGVLIGLVLKFRAKEGQKAQYITGEVKSEKRWITIPHAIVLVLDVVIIVAAINVWIDVKQTLPQADATVRVTGQQWAWSFDHPGLDGKLDTEDDIHTVDELHIVVDKTYHFRLGATDVVHSFSVPVFRLKQDAIPGREIVGWFKATKTGEYDIQCAEMCGIGHGIMAGRIFIETEEQHRQWLSQKLAEQKAAAGTPLPATPPAAPAPSDAEATPPADGAVPPAGQAPAEGAVPTDAEAPPPAEAPAPATGAAGNVEGGKAIYQKVCIACHSLDGTRLVGPTMKGMYGRASKATDGKTYTVDDNFIRQSILEPNKVVAEGYPPAMVLAQKLTDAEIASIILYIKTLK